MKSLHNRIVLSTAMLASCALAVTIPARADVKLSALWSDGLIVQRQMAIPVWGMADAGEKVTVTLGAATGSATTGPDGKWSVKLPALEAASGLQMTVQGKNKLTIQDVAVGEVWVASGQSNMELRVPRTLNADQEIADAHYPLIRQFRVARNIAQTPQTQLKGDWVEAVPATVDQFSAVGYYFARDLYNKLNVPIGIIHASYGGTPAQSWTPAQTLATDADLQLINQEWQKTLDGYPEATKKYDEQLARWQERADAAKKAGKTEPQKPYAPAGPGTKQRPSGLYNGMIAPLTPFAVRGVIWYQGESDHDAALYGKLFPALIQGWRRDFGDDLPFYYVQLANFRTQQTQPVEADGWQDIRAAQDKALALPKTGRAVAIDLGEAKEIHYSNKQEVGRRLALVALNQQYSEKIEYSGPQYQNMKVEGGALRLNFTHAAGMKAKGGDLKGFAIAGADDEFSWANAHVDGDDIILSSPAVAAPTQARYDWASNPIGNLVNSADLPAAPFRTDDAPLASNPTMIDNNVPDTPGVGEAKTAVTDAALDAPDAGDAAQDGKPTRTVVYKKTVDAAGQPMDLEMNVFEPSGHKVGDKTPAIVLFYGGGWSSGSPDLFFAHATYLASRGMEAFVPSYRTKNSAKTTPFEAVTDAKSAIRWVRENAATLGIDPNRIAAAGSSAGGHIAATAAIIPSFDEPTENAKVSSRPDALILYNPVIDLSPSGYGNERVGPKWQSISPLQNVKPGDPPTIVFHGTADKTVPYANAVAFEQAMKDAGNAVELVTFRGVGHGFAYRPAKKDANRALRLTDEFLAKLGYLQGEPTLAPATQ